MKNHSGAGGDPERIFLHQSGRNPLLRKIANIREIGANTELIDLLLKKANQPFTLEELITQLGSDKFRQVYINLDPEIQHQIEIIITPLAVLAGPGRRMARKESEIWQKRHLIHQLKTEEIQTPKDTKRRTWEEVSVESHSRGILTHKTKDQIYWTLRDKRDDATLTLEDKQLLEASAKQRNHAFFPPNLAYCSPVPFRLLSSWRTWLVLRFK